MLTIARNLEAIHDAISCLIWAVGASAALAFLTVSLMIVYHWHASNVLRGIDAKLTALIASQACRPSKTKLDGLVEFRGDLSSEDRDFVHANADVLALSPRSTTIEQFRAIVADRKASAPVADQGQHKPSIVEPPAKPERPKPFYYDRASGKPR